MFIWHLQLLWKIVVILILLWLSHHTQHTQTHISENEMEDTDDNWNRFDDWVRSKKKSRFLFENSIVIMCFVCTYIYVVNDVQHFDCNALVPNKFSNFSKDDCKQILYIRSNCFDREKKTTTTEYFRSKYSNFKRALNSIRCYLHIYVSRE